MGERSARALRKAGREVPRQYVPAPMRLFRVGSVFVVIGAGAMAVLMRVCGFHR